MRSLRSKKSLLNGHHKIVIVMVKTRYALSSFQSWINLKGNIAYRLRDGKTGTMAGMEPILLPFAPRIEFIILAR